MKSLSLVQNQIVIIRVVQPRLQPRISVQNKDWVKALSGQSYAIPVYKCHTHKMDKAVKTFVGYAKKHSDKILYAD